MTSNTIKLPKFLYKSSYFCVAHITTGAQGLCETKTRHARRDGVFPTTGAQQLGLGLGYISFLRSLTRSTFALCASSFRLLCRLIFAPRETSCVWVTSGSFQLLTFCYNSYFYSFLPRNEISHMEDDSFIGLEGTLAIL